MTTLFFVFVFSWASSVLGDCIGVTTTYSNISFNANDFVGVTYNVPDSYFVGGALYRQNSESVSGTFYVIPDKSTNTTSAIASASFSSSSNIIYGNTSVYLVPSNLYTFLWVRDAVGGPTTIRSSDGAQSSFYSGAWNNVGLEGQWCFASASPTPSVTPSTSATPSPSSSSTVLLSTFSAVTMSIEGYISTFDADQFISDIADILDIDSACMEIIEVSRKSVQILFRIYDTPTTSSADEANHLKELVDSNDPSFAAYGITVLDIAVDTSNAASTDNKHGKSGGLSTGLIIAIAVGVPAAIAVVGLATILVYRKKKSRNVPQGSSTVEGTSFELSQGNKDVQHTITSNESGSEDTSIDSKDELTKLKEITIENEEDTAVVESKQQLVNFALTDADAQPENFALVPVDKSSKEFDEVEMQFRADFQNHHEYYVVLRVKNNQLPVTFVLINLMKVNNPELEQQFEICQNRLKTLGRNAEELKIRRAYHGTRASNIEPICKNGLLKIGNPKNPSQATDPGWFGDPKKGVYVSRYVEYTTKYSNNLAHLEPGDRVKIIMFKVLPGRSFTVATVTKGMAPAEGYDSHSSPRYLEWYLFDESQACPVFVLEVQAIENNRVKSDDS